MAREELKMSESLFPHSSYASTFEDITISEDHFEKDSVKEKANVFIIKNLLANSGVEAHPIEESHFLDLEGLVQEIDNNYELLPRRFIEGVKHFRAHKMLPLVVYNRDNGEQDIYMGIQGEQRSQMTRGEYRDLPPEELIKKRAVIYNSENPEGIAAEISMNVTSDLMNLLRSKNFNPRFVLLTLKEFDLIEKYICDSKARKDALGEIDEADPGEKTMWKIFERAVDLGATDVHIEAWDEKTGVARYRVDGYLIKEQLPRSRIRHIVSAIKVKAKMDIAEKRQAQEGGMHFTEAYFDKDTLNEHKELQGYNLRVETLPTVNDEAISVRFLPQDRDILSLEELGYESALCEKIREVGLNSQGLIIVTGPTGSGKTTTLYSILQGINKPDIRILTIENPVEYRMKGLIQGEVNDKAGYGFAEAVPAFLRADPDVALVGEMRDSRTREAALQLAQTGHLVFATLHTNDAPSTIKRLYDLGATSSDLQSSLTAIVAQRLTRRLCKDCKEDYNGTEHLNSLFGERLVEKEVHLYKAKGKVNGKDCLTCRGTGYKGRIVVPSFWEVGDKSRELFEHEYSYTKLLRSSIEDGMTPLTVSGMKLVLEGISSLEELDGDVVPKGEIRKYKGDIMNLIKLY